MICGCSIFVPLFFLSFYHFFSRIIVFSFWEKSYEHFFLTWPNVNWSAGLNSVHFEMLCLEKKSLDEVGFKPGWITYASCSWIRFCPIWTASSRDTAISCVTSKATSEAPLKESLNISIRPWCTWNNNQCWLWEALLIASTQETTRTSPGSASTKANTLCSLACLSVGSSLKLKAGFRVKCASNSDSTCVHCDNLVFIAATDLLAVQSRLILLDAFLTKGAH